MRVITVLAGIWNTLRGMVGEEVGEWVVAKQVSLKTTS